MGPSFQVEMVGFEVQERTMVVSYLRVVGVEGNVIFQGATHQAVRLRSRMVQEPEAVAWVEGVET